MRIARLASASIAAIALAATFGSVTALGQSGTLDGVKASAVVANQSGSASAQFATLAKVKAVPMSSAELDAVKGQHVHFLDAGGGKLHLAGDIKTENNWKNLGGTDGMAVAPSYHGLCVAHSRGAIFIPTAPGVPVTSQCP
jgi:hypothetical protein